MADKPVVPASKALKDIGTGLSDAQIMAKYSLASRGLQSMISKLVAMGLIEQAELDSRNHNGSQGQISAKEFVAHVKAGKTDLDLMADYDLSPQWLNNMFAKLIKSGYITQADLDARRTPHSA